MSPDPLPDPDAMSKAEEWLVRWLAESGAHDSKAFDALCAAHPELAAHLRSLHSDWKRMDSIAPWSAFPPPFDQIRQRLENAFDERLRDTILFGSRARGDHRADSNLDLPVVL